MDLAQLELELIDLLQGQGWSVAEIYLIGLLGQGNRASVFSVIIDGVHYVLKVYDSKDSLQAELGKLKRMSKDRLLLWWQEQPHGPQCNLAIIEVPEGRELNSDLLSESVITRLTDRLAELHRIRYRQKVAVNALREAFERYQEPFMAHIALMGRPAAQYGAVSRELSRALRGQPELFRVSKVRIHGDLWWPNIIVAAEDVYLVDWESLRRGDAAEEIATLRLNLYSQRSVAAPTFFWQAPEHTERVGRLMARIVERDAVSGGSEQLRRRLAFYLPYQAMRYLAERYLAGETAGAINMLLADEFLQLARDPLALPPALTMYNYYDEISAQRGAIKEPV
jgi:Phosphotransferase enzyme family